MFFHRLVLAFFFVSIILLATHLHTSVPSVSNSKFRLPAMAGVTLEVSQGNYEGDHSATNGSQYALDFKVGTTNFIVAAAQGGMVIGADDSSTSSCTDANCWTDANYVVIADDDGTTAALYLHLLPHSLKVHSGMHVNPGDPLGQADTTGWATGPHLHFQVEVIPSIPAQPQQSPGWWWTNSLPTTFSNPEVLAQDANGIPQTGQSFVISNQPTPIPTTPTPILVPTPPPTPTPVDFSPFVGHWFGQARALTFSSDGHAYYTGRVFEWCSQSVPPPCDSMNGNDIIGGLDTHLLFTRIISSTAYGTIISGTGDREENSNVLKVGDTISITLGPNDTLSVSDGWVLCGPNTPSSDPVYQSCIGG